MNTRNLVTTLIFSAVALGSLGSMGCGRAPAVESIAGSPQAIVRGTVEGLGLAGEAATVALVWTYWNPEDCEAWIDAAGNEGRSCSGSTLATTATIEQGTNGFVLTQAEPPPAFVHGFDTEIAEAVIALLPEGDLSAYDVRTGVPSMRGISRQHMIVHVPEDLPADRFEAQSLGGAALGQGFHLVRALAGGPQIEGTAGPLGCPAGEACTVYTSQAGEIAAEGEGVVIQVGDADMPALFL